ncbi:ABC transporter permease [Lignipirellula cremea]|uniref:Dipeptide transport system permease protein DppC n=1 Tax=Lignipirellula cremea TaxID=2528010 RepID=A0A518E1C8_9BACT|nr:ABC transporter permease [Lignipirellula cremea]QDU97898.1 Dipeptide transport system permease protein DppC [Lignipirellula cremea]
MSHSELTPQAVDTKTAPTVSPVDAPPPGEAYLDIVWRQFRRNKPALISLYILPSLFLIAIFAPAIASWHPIIYYDGHLSELSRNWRAVWTLEDSQGEPRIRLRVNGLTSKQTTGEEAVITSADDKYVLRRASGENSDNAIYFSSDAKLIQSLQKVEIQPLQLSVTIDDKPYQEPVGTTIYPWWHAIFNPPETVDYFFNMAMIGFFPWLLGSLVWGWRQRQRRASTRNTILQSLGAYAVLIVLLCLVFAIPGAAPHNAYKTRTFVNEDFKDPLQHGVYVLIPFNPINDDDTLSRRKPPGYSKPADEARDSNDTAVHLLGTDPVGADVMTRMLYGTRVALTVGFVAVSLYLTIGVIVGAIAGYFGGWVDILISRLIEVMMVFPAFFLILTLVALIGPNIYVIMSVIGITGWPHIARLTRGEVLKQREIDYTAASRALGASHWRILFRHILPNALSPALVSAPFGIAGAIVTESGLSLLGFGLRPPAPSWGSILNAASKDYSLWWMIVFPSLAIFVTVTVFNLVGSGLRDAMDPRLRV